MKIVGGRDAAKIVSLVVLRRRPQKLCCKRWTHMFASKLSNFEQLGHGGEVRATRFIVVVERCIRDEVHCTVE
jgi:hypothetical protein